MKDFIFRNDTKLFFRNDIRATLAEIARGHKAMFVYGGGSVKRNGCRDDIIQALTGSGIPFVEYGAPRASSPAYKRASASPKRTA